MNIQKGIMIIGGAAMLLVATMCQAENIAEGYGVNIPVFPATNIATPVRVEITDVTIVKEKRESGAQSIVWRLSGTSTILWVER